MYQFVSIHLLTSYVSHLALHYSVDLDNRVHCIGLLQGLNELLFGKVLEPTKCYIVLVE